MQKKSLLKKIDKCRINFTSLSDIYGWLAIYGIFQFFDYRDNFFIVAIKCNIYICVRKRIYSWILNRQKIFDYFKGILGKLRIIFIDNRYQGNWSSGWWLDTSSYSSCINHTFSYNNYWGYCKCNSVIGSSFWPNHRCSKKKPLIHRGSITNFVMIATKHSVL